MTASVTDTLARLVATGRPAVLVTIVEAEGSTPRDAGTRMIVTAAHLTGTIGGGRLECEAVRAARAMLADGRCEAKLSVPLGPRLGQCCGGYVLLDLHRADPALVTRVTAEAADETAAEPLVALFGAGHVGRALAQALAPLPLRFGWYDPLGEAGVAGLPPPPPPCRTVATPLVTLAELPAGAAVVIMTHDHPLDFALAEAALRRGDCAYVGMIGSATKRSRFERQFLANGGPPQALSGLVSPIGGAVVHDKRPPVIAALVAAELLVALAAAITAAARISVRRRG